MKKGFTLIELLVVIAIIIMILGMIVVVPSRDKSRLRSDLAIIQGFFERAKSRAIASRRLQYVVLFYSDTSDTETLTYTGSITSPGASLQGQSMSLVLFDSDSTPGANNRIDEAMLAARTHFYGPFDDTNYGTHVTFYPDGSCIPIWGSAANTHQILLSNETNTIIRTMEITNGTGKIRAKDE